MADYQLSLTCDEIDASLVNLNQYVCDASETDQGVVGDGNSLKDLIDDIGTSKSATIYLLHDPSAGNTTTYTLTTSESIPDNIYLCLQPGAILDGAGTLTFDNPGQIDARPSQHIFGSSITVVFTNPNTLYPEWWGADPYDSAVDDTAAFQSALDAALTDVTIKGNVKLRAGTYNVNNLNWFPQVLISGVDPGVTSMRFNGTGGAGTTILKVYRTGAVTGSIPKGGIEKVKLDGWDHSATGEVCENLILWAEPTMGIDFFMRIRDVYFHSCYGDAFKKATTGIVNFHMESLRFDGIGGFGIYLLADITHESRPITIDKLTMDNNHSGDFTTLVTSEGHFNGTNWGKGLMRIDDGHGLSIKISDARVELNYNLISHNDKRAMFHFDNSASMLSYITLINFQGYFQPEDMGIFIYSHNADRVSWTTINSAFRSSSNFYVAEGAPLECVPGRSESANINQHVSNDQLKRGARLAGLLVEGRSSSPASAASFAYYKKGDLVFRNDTEIGEYQGWTPDATNQDGFGIGTTNQTIDSAADCTAASAVINVGTMANGRYFFVGQNVRLTGAGVAAADLDTYIIDMDPDDETITVNDAPSTTVDPLTILSLQASMTNILPFTNVTYAGDPTGNLTPLAIGEECLDTANSAWYKSHGMTSADWKKITP